MTIRDYDRDMVLGQKYAIECEFHLKDCEDEASTWETYHFQIGDGRPNPFFDDTVDYFRVVYDEIYFHIHRTIDDLDEVPSLNSIKSMS